MVGPTSLADRMRALRAAVPDLSARDVDRLAGRTPGHAAKMESGALVRLMTDVAVDYARVFGSSLDWLVLGDKKRRPGRARIRAAVAAARAAYAQPGVPAPNRRRPRA